jgi:hypothetical protein
MRTNKTKNHWELFFQKYEILKGYLNLLFKFLMRILKVFKNGCDNWNLQFAQKNENRPTLVLSSFTLPKTIKFHII